MAENQTRSPFFLSVSNKRNSLCLHIAHSYMWLEVHQILNKNDEWLGFFDSDASHSLGTAMASDTIIDHTDKKT